MTLTPFPNTEMPVLPLRGLAVFPNMTVHFDVAREASIKALDEAMSGAKPVFLVAQRDLTVESPEQKDLYSVGTVAQLRQILRMPGDNVRVVAEGTARGKLISLSEAEGCLYGQIEELASPPVLRNSAKTEALIRQVYGLFEAYTELSPKLSSETFLRLLGSDDPGYIADQIAQGVPMRVEDKQAILEQIAPVRRLELVSRILRREVDILQAGEELEAKLHEQLYASQRDYFLREQLKVLKRELGEDEDSESEEYREKLAKLPVSDEIREKLEREIGRLEKQPFGSADGAVLRNYLDACLELPWGKRTKERVSVPAVRKTLDADHFGLEKVKERILEYVAVRQLAPDLKGQILCLVGPPGVGKTSVAMSVARAMNRKLARISLGGIHDEADIRGHRKTYIGAMPGRIIAAIRQAGSMNPLLLLDEIDKLGRDQRGDPASALLEVLDAEQNAAFRDHFLEIPFDLSDVLFVTTANSIETIPRPLLDRMEVIELPSYTDEEKVEIAKRHLLPKQLKRHGLTRAKLKITDNGLRRVIRGYTRESGVRTLERELATLCRKAAMSIVDDDVKGIHITEKNLETYLGAPRFHPEEKPREDQVGIVNGLAWTQTGGELLEVEVNVVPGAGKIVLTGNLGDVMKESAKAALSYVRSRARRLGVEEDFYKTRDIHVHFPEGAVPKDGPSAGVAITSALVSALTGIPVRRDVAMTGEVTLRGRVLPIGGLREKTMAALRSGIKTVLIPEENKKDLEEIDQTVRSALTFVTVEQVDVVLAHALVTQPVGVEELAPDVAANWKSPDAGMGLRQ